jgi:predicted ArsR family transcriptional regulator
VERVTVGAAAKKLGISESAIRQRIHRGTMLSLRGEDGRTYVMIDDEEQSNDVTNPYINALTSQIEELQADKDHLWEENQRLQAIIMQLSQKIPDPKQQPEESVGLKELTEATRLVGEKTLWAITQYTRLRRKG